MSHLSQSFSVKFDYKIHFTNFLFNIENTTLADFFRERTAEGGQKIYFVIDEGVFIAHPNLINEIRTYFSVHSTVVLLPDFAIVPGGERSKNDTGLFDKIIDAVDAYGIDRHSYIAAIGGGAVLDLVGYAAAVAHRGIKHIRIPTTVLSQNDSGIGVKNGINYKGKKNFLGTFSPPAAVFNDPQFLTSLTDRDYRSGISEAIKVALIKDQEFFCWIENHAVALTNRVPEHMNYLIKYCAKLHLAHIGGTDPFEMGSARPLDFGHWSAHKQEQLSNFGVLHGEAVAMGIALDSTYSFLAGFLTEDKLHRILNVLLHLSFEITDPIMTINDLQSPVLKGLAEFREHLGGKLTITLLTDLGTGKEVHEISPQLLVEASTYITNFLENSTSLSFNND